MNRGIHGDTMNMSSSQTFFPGHEDIDKVHVPSSDGTYCTKCKMDLRGRGDLRIVSDDTEEYKVLRRKNHIKRETDQMTQQSLLRAMKQLYQPPPQQGSMAALQAKVEARGSMAALQQSAQQDSMAALHAIEAEQSLLRAKFAEERRFAAENSMNQGIARKMGELTPGQREAARQNAEKALAIALFHTDPRIHAHLLMDAANDERDMMEAALAKAWREDLQQWRTQAVERAARMVAIMDGLIPHPASKPSHGG